MYSLFMEWAMVHRPFFYKLTAYRPDAENSYLIDLSQNSPHLKYLDVNKPEAFENYLNDLLSKTNTKMAIGGYMEHRSLYNDKGLFNQGISDQERFIHLGIDIWMPSGTQVFAPLEGRVHSFADNKGKGNYGPTIILKHNPAPELYFYTLYGHLSRKDLKGISVGDRVEAGQTFAHFGTVEENGKWAPHLHFQIIMNLQGFEGDYYGVTSLKSLEFEKRNCPDPNIIINCPLL